jgi:hypothetical protein
MKRHSIRQEMSKGDLATLKRLQSMIARGVLAIENTDLDDGYLSINAIKLGYTGVATIKCLNPDYSQDYNHKHLVPITVT